MTPYENGLAIAITLFVVCAGSFGLVVWAVLGWFHNSTTCAFDSDSETAKLVEEILDPEASRDYHL